MVSEVTAGDHQTVQRNYESDWSKRRPCWAALHYLQVSWCEEDYPLFPSFHRDELSGLPCDPVHNID